MGPEIFLPVALVIGYLFGSIPFGVILTRLAGTQDLRSIGSGSIGATNVLRTGNKGLAAATLLGDMLKGTAAVVLTGTLWGPNAAMLAGLGAFLGHLYPVWLGFRGGKGVATLLGILLALLWPAALVYAAVWLFLLMTLRISSLAGMTAAATAPIVAYALNSSYVPLLLGFALLVLWKHRENILRLRKGTEPRIGSKTSSTA